MADGAAPRRSFALVVAGLLLALVGLAVPAGPAGPAPAMAQGTTFDCTVGAGPAASPAGGGRGEPRTAASPADFPEEGGELTVFAAASLTEPFEQIAGDLEAAHPGLDITFNFAGSQALATQLNEGAAADVFASANGAQMVAAIADGSVAGEPATFARNRLAIVVAAGNPAGVERPADLGADGVRLVLTQADAPAGRYARESVCRMGEDAATYGDRFVERVAANVVSEEEDVRGVLTKVQLGEADAGIVYVSDALGARDLGAVIAIPEGVNVVASYPIAAMAGGDDALAAAFIGYVLGPEGQATLAAFGFEQGA